MVGLTGVLVGFVIQYGKGVDDLVRDAVLVSGCCFGKWMLFW